MTCLEAGLFFEPWHVSCLDNLGNKEVIFESDSKIMVKAVAGPREWPRLKDYIYQGNYGEKEDSLGQPLLLKEVKSINAPIL